MKMKNGFDNDIIVGIDIGSENIFCSIGLIENENNNVSLIKSGEIFCKNIVKDECIYQINKKPLYYDNNHLSHLGAEILMNELIYKIKGTY